MLYLSVKALHIILVTSWFAGLFYLPRLFVNHAMVSDKATLERLELMEFKLYRFMTPLGILAVALGMWLWFGFGFEWGGWLHAKTLLIVYHLYCGRLMRAFAEGRNTRSHVWYRFFNEVPVLVLFVVVFLVVLKPF
ncbi:MAG: CopD family protein [Zoogloea sp.]|nr:CopD family protein [Zoogloea sp.]